jgi:hypothetical protein
MVLDLIVYEKPISFILFYCKHMHFVKVGVKIDFEDAAPCAGI